MRSLRPTGWRRVSVRAGPTDRLEDSPKGRQPDLHRVRPGSGTHPHADQFCLCSGGPSAGYVNPRCRLCLISPTEALGGRGDHPCACPKTHTDTGLVALREGQADSLDHLVMGVRPRQADQTSNHPHPE